MLTFLKAQTASIIATTVDFSITIILVEIFGFEKVIASVCGTIAGAITHFLISRHWVFEATDGRMRSQALKYFLVWIVYLLITTSGFYFMNSYLKVNYIISKVFVAVIMSVSYNYFLHKKFVFK